MCPESSGSRVGHGVVWVGHFGPTEVRFRLDKADGIMSVRLPRCGDAAAGSRGHPAARHDSVCTDHTGPEALTLISDCPHGSGRISFSQGWALIIHWIMQFQQNRPGTLIAKTRNGRIRFEGFYTTLEVCAMKRTLHSGVLQCCRNGLIWRPSDTNNDGTAGDGNPCLAARHFGSDSAQRSR